MMLPILILLPSLCPFVCPPFYMPLLSLHLIGLGIGLLDDVCMGLMRGDVLKLSCCLWFLLVPVCFSIASFSISSSKPLRPIIPFCLVPSSHPLQHIPTHPAIWSNPFTISSLLSSSRRLLGCWFLTYLDFACDVSCPRLSHLTIQFAFMDIIGVVSSIVVVGLIRDAACLCLEPSYYLLVIFLPLHLSFLLPV